MHRDVISCCCFRLFDKLGKVPSLDCTDPWSREGTFQGPEDKGQHSKVWPHLPLFLHWQSQAEEQGPHLQIPCQQMQHCLEVNCLQMHLIVLLQQHSMTIRPVSELPSACCCASKHMCGHGSWSSDFCSSSICNLEARPEQQHRHTLKQRCG